MSAVPNPAADEATILALREMIAHAEADFRRADMESLKAHQHGTAADKEAAKLALNKARAEVKGLRDMLPADAPAAPVVPAGTVPPVPTSMHIPPPTGIGAYVGTATQAAMFQGYVWVQDVNRIVSPDGLLMDTPKFDGDPRFAGRIYQVRIDTSEPSRSAWEAFVKNEVGQGTKVRGMRFDPRQEPGAIIAHEGQLHVNTWRPVSIRMVPGDVTPFLAHLSKLFPADWRLLLNYLKFMVQRKGVKATWWPFIQGVAGNGKSFISDTMEYCVGERYTNRPNVKNIGSEFNGGLYGCLFLAIEDVKISKDYETFWETLKPMVTGTRLEIQYKGVDKVTREVCFNAILNSNHKNGIRKEPDDRRIAPFFAAQQRKGDLARNGLTPEYFKALWEWAKPELGGDGWAHIAHYLATDPIDADFDHTQCPITSATQEAIRVGRPPAQQELLAAIKSSTEGFKGGWINLNAVETRLRSRNFGHISPQGRMDAVDALGYIPHPGLTEGQLTVALPDSTLPVLYVLPDHTTLSFTDAAAIAAAYHLAQQPTVRGVP